MAMVRLINSAVPRSLISKAQTDSAGFEMQRSEHGVNLLLNTFWCRQQYYVHLIPIECGQLWPVLEPGFLPALVRPCPSQVLPASRQYEKLDRASLS